MPKNLILFVLILAKFLLQFHLNGSDFDLHRDEYLHLDQGAHLAWGYVSLPPVTACISYIIHLLGGSVFWVRFFPALFGALTIAVVWKTIEALGGSRFALLLGGLGVLFSALLRLNGLYQPNSLDVLAWTALYYFIIRYIRSGDARWCYAAAVCFAIGFLNKYNIAFLLLGFLPALLLTPQRKLLFRKDVVYAGILALVIIAPHIFWQYQRGFPVVHHMEELRKTQLVNVDTAGFLKAQLLFFLASLPVIVAGLIGLALYPPFRPYRSFLWAFVFTLGLFLYLQAKDYYAIGLYPIYIAFGSAYLGTRLMKGWKAALKPVLLVLPPALFAFIYNIVFPTVPPQKLLERQEDFRKLGMLRWEDGKEHPLPQDFADMLGWKELARKVEDAAQKLPPGYALVLCDNYGQAGAINYYSKGKLQAVSFNADYIDWFPFDKKIRHLIRVKEGRDSSEELPDTSPFFATGILAGQVEDPLAREYGTCIFVFTDAKVDVKGRLKKEVEERRW